MENDILKEHVSGRRQEFELYELDTQSSWSDIEKKLNEEQKGHVTVPLKYIWRVAAMFLMVLGAAFYLMWLNMSDNDLDFASSTELAEADEYYGELITTKVLQIKSSSPEIDQDIFQDIDALDEAFRELKEDLKDHADNEEVVNAMILNYKIKLEILEKILNEIEGKKERKRKIDGNEG